MATRKKTTAKRSTSKKKVAAKSARKKATRKTTRKAAARSSAGKTARKKATARATPAKAAPRKPAARTPTPAELLAEKIVRATEQTPADLDFTELYTEDCISHEPRSEPAVGFAGLEAKARQWSDLQKRSTWKARHVMCKDDTIVIEWEAEVELRDGRTLPFCEVAVHTVRDGKIGEERFYYDPSVFEPEVVSEEAAEEAAPRRPAPPRSAARPVTTPGTPPIDPIDL